jgi:hypothetical protein
MFPTRTLPTLLVALALAAMSPGCAQLFLARTIQTFADGLAQNDLDQLKQATTDQFDEKALRLSEALDDLKILNLPTGKVSVAQVEEVSEHERRLTVEMGEQKKEVLYKLVRRPGHREWLVDDVYLKQKKPGMDEPITKSVTESMDLLLTVREFLKSWQTGSREEVLAITTPSFQELLSDLSPVHLQQLTTQIVGKRATQGTHKPEARIEESRAVVILPRVGGQLVIELEMQADGWRVNDVAVRATSKDAQVRSARRMTQILRATGHFLFAYDQADLPWLQELSTQGFYRNSLAVGDLTTVPLPVHELMATAYEIRTHDGHADVILATQETTFVLTLTEQETDADSQRVGPYIVEEVTMYDGDKSQVRRLSAQFTSHAMLEIFAQALADRDLNRLRQASTRDFNEQVWDHCDEELLNALPWTDIEPVPPRVVATVFQGSVTEVTVTQGSRALTYVLRESRDQMAVDDVLLPAVNRPNSLKQNLTVLLPVYAMARGVFRQDLAAVRSLSSPELSRLVWEPLGGIPTVETDLVRHLTAPVSALSLSDKHAELVLGDAHWGARIALVRQGGQFVLDDVLLIAGPEAAQQTELKRLGRLRVASDSASLGHRP